jgi:hypothetical protein
MWLPEPIYERFPQFLLLLGLLFMFSGTYLGFDYEPSYFYFGVGFACYIWSLSVFSIRRRRRQDAKYQQNPQRPQQTEGEQAG